VNDVYKFCFFVSCFGKCENLSIITNEFAKNFLSLCVVHN